MENNETQLQQNNQPDDLKVPAPSLERGYSKTKLYIFILLATIILTVGYFIYSHSFVKTPAVQAPAKNESQTQAALPVFQVKALLESRHGKLQFLNYTKQGAVVFNTLPDSIKNLTAGADEKTADQIVFDDGQKGYLVTMKYNNGDLIKVYENIVTAQESSDWKRLVMERSEKFAFGDFENSQFNARISLVLENGKLSGEILVGAKK